MSLSEVISPVSGQTKSTVASLNSLKEETLPLTGDALLEASAEDVTAPLFGTQDEEDEDARLWETQFAATPDDKLNKLVETVQAKIRAGKSYPMDFTNK